MNHDPGEDTYTLETPELSGAHIGKGVQFYWRFPKTGVFARITGELRQIYQTESMTVLHLSSGMDEHTGELQEFVFDIPARVTVNPEEQ